MLSSIHPLGERAKDNRFSHTAVAFVVGSVLGGALVGVVAAAAGAALGPTGLPGSDAAVVVVAVVAGLGALAERTGTTLPSLRRQVDEDWLHEYRGWVYGAGFGIQLGAGVATIITSAAVYVAVVAATLVGSAPAAVSVVALFGLVRGASLLAVREVDTPDRLRAVHRRLHATAPAVRRASTAALAIVAAGAGLTAVL